MARKPYETEHEDELNETATYKVPYIVDLYRKEEVLLTTFNFLTNLTHSRNGKLYELGKQLREYMGKKSVGFFFEGISEAILDIKVDFWVRGDRSILIHKVFDSNLSSDNILELHDLAKDINRDLRTMSNYWALCGYTLPMSSNELLSLMTEIYR